MDVEEDLFSSDSLFYTERKERAAHPQNCVEQFLAGKRQWSVCGSYSLAESATKLHARVDAHRRHHP